MYTEMMKSLGTPGGESDADLEGHLQTHTTWKVAKRVLAKQPKKCRSIASFVSWALGKLFKMPQNVPAV